MFERSSSQERHKKPTVEAVKTAYLEALAENAELRTVCDILAPILTGLIAADANGPTQIPHRCWRQCPKTAFFLSAVALRAAVHRQRMDVVEFLICQAGVAPCVSNIDFIHHMKDDDNGNGMERNNLNKKKTRSSQLHHHQKQRNNSRARTTQIGSEVGISAVKKGFRTALHEAVLCEWPQIKAMYTTPLVHTAGERCLASPLIDEQINVKDDDDGTVHVDVSSAFTSPALPPPLRSSVPSSPMPSKVDGDEREEQQTLPPTIFDLLLLTKYRRRCLCNDCVAAKTKAIEEKEEEKYAVGTVDIDLLYARDDEKSSRQDAKKRRAQRAQIAGSKGRRSTSVFHLLDAPSGDTARCSEGDVGDDECYTALQLAIARGRVENAMYLLDWFGKSFAAAGGAVVDGAATEKGWAEKGDHPFNAALHTAAAFPTTTAALLHRLAATLGGGGGGGRGELTVATTTTGKAKSAQCSCLVVDLYNSRGQTPLHIAVLHGLFGIARVLVAELGADVTLPMLIPHAEGDQDEKQRNKTTKKRGRKGRGPAQRKTTTGHSGVDTFAPSPSPPNSSTVLHMLASQAERCFSPLTVRVFIESIRVRHCRLMSQDEKEKRKEKVENTDDVVLSEQAAFINTVRSRDHATALFVAISSGHFRFATFLLNAYGGELGLVDASIFDTEYGNTVLLELIANRGSFTIPRTLPRLIATRGRSRRRTEELTQNTETAAATATATNVAASNAPLLAEKEEEEQSSSPLSSLLERCHPLYLLSQTNRYGYMDCQAPLHLAVAMKRFEIVEDLLLLVISETEGGIASSKGGGGVAESSEGFFFPPPSISSSSSSHSRLPCAVLPILTGVDKRGFSLLHLMTQWPVSQALTPSSSSSPSSPSLLDLMRLLVTGVAKECELLQYQRQHNANTQVDGMQNVEPQLPSSSSSPSTSFKSIALISQPNIHLVPLQSLVDAFVNAQTPLTGYTALHYAAQRLQFAAMSLLVREVGVDTEVTDSSGRTALILAAFAAASPALWHDEFAHHTKAIIPLIFKLLLYVGSAASAEWRDARGHSALRWVESYAQTCEFATLLKAEMIDGDMAT